MVADSPTQIDTFTVALLEPVNSGDATSPANDSERLLYRATSDTPLRLDCQGHALPGFAKSWEKDSTSRTWTLTLNDRVRSADGSPMTARDVAAWWNERLPVEGAMALQPAAALDDRRISVSLSGPQDSVPTMLADPAFSLAIDPTQRPSGVKFELEAGTDPRDALDRGADLVVTRDPALVDYMAGRTEFTTFPLPWSRTYVLVQPAAAQPIEAVRGEAERRSLARDAVSADARAAEPPFWWGEVAACPARLASGPTPGSSRVAYVRGDEVARGLAERIVALAGSGTRLSAAALEPADFAMLLQTGSDQAFVVALPRHTLTPCRESAAWPAGVRIQPLIDTRAHAIVRKGAPPLTVEWDGTVRVVPR
ncbi:MAG: ABC transporter substrate-binding protein [Gemmatimonadales bacterium]